MSVLIEVCVDSLSGAKIAQSFGADRLELCANLPIGGTTPSAGLLRQVRDAVDIPVNVLIRPRGGDFLYNTDEIVTMIEDIHFAKENGADGIVSGVLHPQGAVDPDLLRRLISAARPLPFTFHRAFDQIGNAEFNQAVLEMMGVERLLTSGQAPSAVEGIPLLKKMMFASENVCTMPGGGISPENITTILDELHPSEIHFSGTKTVSSAMKYHSSVMMGREDSTDSRMVTDPDRLGLLISSVRAWEATQI